MRPSPFNAGVMADFKYQSQQKPLSAEEQQKFIDAHEQMHADLREDYQAEQTLAELTKVELPEPIGGHRANLITFSIRASLYGLDKRPDWDAVRRKEWAYNGIREISRAALVSGRQTGKPGAQPQVREFLSHWLNYIEQITQEPTNGR